MDKLRLASAIQQDSIVDGPGIRMVVWTQGCMHHCPGCHNPQTHDVQGGFLYDVEAAVQEINDAPLQTGLTLSGGEPFLQALELIPLVKAAKAKHWDVWAYSGFTYEQLLRDDRKRPLLEMLDVLVDGKFVENLRDYRLKFKGSRNQRIIDVAESLKQKSVVLSKYDKENMELEKEITTHK